MSHDEKDKAILLVQGFFLNSEQEKILANAIKDYHVNNRSPEGWVKLESLYNKLTARALRGRKPKTSIARGNLNEVYYSA